MDDASNYSQEIFVAAEKYSGPGTPDVITIAKSEDYGKSFSPILLNIDDTIGLWMPRMKQISNSEIGLVYSSQNGANIYFSKVNKDFDPISITTQMLDKTANYVSRPFITSDFKVYPSLSFIYVVYYELNDNTRLQFTFSTDDGNTWSTPVAIDVFNRPSLEYCSMSFKNDVLSVAYTTGSSNDIKVCYSLDFGNLWSTPVTLTDFTPTHPAKHPEIAVVSSTNWFVFYEYKNSISDHDIYYSYTVDGGSSWNGPMDLAVTASNEVYPTIRKFYGGTIK